MLNPDMYEQAADYIEKNGWWDGKQYEKPDKPPVACIVNALGYVEMSGLTFFKYVEYLAAFLGVEAMDDVFRLNDAQPQTTGKLWAIETLRGVSKQLREGINSWESEGGRTD
jgi:hypothetical protein